jgi:hypothetical protein
MAGQDGGIVVLWLLEGRRIPRVEGQPDINGGLAMLRTFHRKAAFTVVAAGAAFILGAGPALAAGGWTIVAAPPTGQNATLTSVAAISDSDAWAVG